MIHRIYANDPNFKPIEFQVGLNIILADKNQESDNKDSRNGLGKTTLINIIHFCFGSDVNKKALPIKEIHDWIFFIELDLGNQRILASRSINDLNVIKVQGNTAMLPIIAEKNQKENFEFYKVTEWKKLLGICFFNLNVSTKNQYTPTFRNLISYFIRSGTEAYNRPFNYFKNQPPWSVQIHNAFLLGLNWEEASRAQELKDRTKTIKALESSRRVGIMPSQGDLEAERISIQTDYNEMKEALSEFKVHNQYKQIQIQANCLTREIHELSNRNLILRLQLDQYEQSTKSEKTPNITSVELLYEEAGLNFGINVKKTLAEAKAFHSTIIKNRKRFLQVEILQIKNELDNNNRDINVKSTERAELMLVLKTHGALEEFILLQEHLTEKKMHLEEIKNKIINIQEISLHKKDIKAKKIELEAKLQRDYDQSRHEWEQAVAGFNKNSQALYNECGNLIINVSENGYSFDVEIPRSNSEGVGKMKIFCYDLMLVDLFSKQNKINFLIHDSTIFDGVDSRQTAHALKYAHEKALESGFQYICAFNSDMIPKYDFNNDFDIYSFIRLTLRDQDPKDSLMGFRFND